MKTEKIFKPRPQIKICGLTNVDEALGCAALGANAIGLVFYPKSPRNVSEDQARQISLALPEEIKKVGVFVNETFSNIMRKVEHCHLNAVQLHGRESPELASRLFNENLVVIKALFVEGEPSLEQAANYEASAYLVECGRGKLPGGNALEWNWEKAKTFGENYPLILAGGLAPENICLALQASAPDAVDVSSSVESGPGRKDLERVKSFIDAVSHCAFEEKMIKKNLRRIF